MLGIAPLSTLPLSTLPAGSGGAVENPPFQRKWLSTVIESWGPEEIEVLWGGLGVTYTTQIDQPPYGLRQWLPAVVRSWDAPDPLPTLPRHLVQPFVAANPPKQQRWLASVIKSWEATDPLPTIPRRLAQGSVAAVDNPPFGSRRQDGIVDQWQEDYQLLWGSAGITYYTQIDEPPYGLKPWLPAVLSAWEPSAPLPTIPRRSVFQNAPAVVNDPPFNARRLDGIIESWQDDWQVLWGPQGVTYYTQIDNPPGAPRSWLPAVLASWEPDTYVPLVYPDYSGGQIADNPPFGLRLWMQTVLEAWKPGDPLPTIPRRLVQPFVPAQVDNPPFGTRRLDGIVEQWHDDYQMLWGPAGITYTTQVDEPPYGLRTWLATVLKAWEVEDPTPVKYARFTESGITPPVPPLDHDIIDGRPHIYPWKPRYNDDEEIIAMAKLAIEEIIRKMLH